VSRRRFLGQTHRSEIELGDTVRGPTLTDECGPPSGIPQRRDCYKNSTIPQTRGVIAFAFLMRKNSSIRGFGPVIASVPLLPTEHHRCKRRCPSSTNQLLQFACRGHDGSQTQDTFDIRVYLHTSLGIPYPRTETKVKCLLVASPKPEARPRHSRAKPGARMG